MKWNSQSSISTSTEYKLSHEAKIQFEDNTYRFTTDVSGQMVDYIIPSKFNFVGQPKVNLMYHMYNSSGHTQAHKIIVTESGVDDYHSFSLSNAPEWLIVILQRAI